MGVIYEINTLTDRQIKDIISLYFNGYSYKDAYNKVMKEGDMVEKS